MSENSYQRDEYYSSFKWVLGKCLYASDIDISLTGGGIVDNEILEEFDGDFNTICLIDAKRQVKGNIQMITNKPFAMQYQICKANRQEICFFSVCTYLDPSWEGEYSYYLHPNNKYARELLESNRPDSPEGVYLSLRGYSKFLHSLRGKKWNPNEPILLKDRWNQNVKLSNAETYCLKDLPSTIYKHPLPKIYKHNFTNSQLKKMGEIE